MLAEERIPKLPIYLDSPMAISIFNIYCQFDELHRLNRAQCHDMTNLVEVTLDVEESKLLHDFEIPHIIIAGSGMATGGAYYSPHETTDWRSPYHNIVYCLLFIVYASGGTAVRKCWLVVRVSKFMENGCR